MGALTGRRGKEEQTREAETRRPLSAPADELRARKLFQILSCPWIVFFLPEFSAVNIFVLPAFRGSFKNRWFLSFSSVKKYFLYYFLPSFVSFSDSGIRLVFGAFLDRSPLSFHFSLYFPPPCIFALNSGRLSRALSSRPLIWRILLLSPFIKISISLF